MRGHGGLMERGTVAAAVASVLVAVAVVLTAAPTAAAIDVAPTGSALASGARVLAPAPRSATSTTLSELEAAVIELHNQARRDAGLPPFTVHDLFVETSRTWSQEMASTGVIGHDPDYVDDSCRRTEGWRTCAENVAVGYDTAAGVHGGWMGSTGHRNNILNPTYNRVGIGVWRDGDGRVYWTARFMAGTDQPTPDPDVHPQDGSGWRSAPTSSAGAGEATSPVARYVDATFEVFTGRSATGAERDDWVARLADGTGRGDFIAALSTSDAWLGNEIDAIYATALGRAPDANGRRYWTETVRAGTRITELGIFVFSSDEFWSRSGGTVDGFVDGAHRGILGRSATADELGRYGAELAAGAPRTVVIDAVYATLESRLGRVDALYDAILGRRADSSGRAYWADVLSVHDDVRLASFLAGSEEFFDRASAGSS